MYVVYCLLYQSGTLGLPGEPQDSPEGSQDDLGEAPRSYPKTVCFLTPFLLENAHRNHPHNGLEIIEQTILGNVGFFGGGKGGVF